MNLKKEYTGTHALVPAKMDAGDDRTVITRIPSEEVVKAVESGIETVEDTEGYTMKAGAYRFKPEVFEEQEKQAEPSSQTALKKNGK